ncbi:hypothetical protein JTE90_009792 [Oedothorax gibbosus]|uniref:Uncharacterized protein n=1 Tax=Oedothorax gibbosus TaxID=931172 RepID=A0AAV6USE0_9ARAC|nr:hypothetical protein JTE90_009792 [Oedothorax gibbosus]
MSSFKSTVPGNVGRVSVHLSVAWHLIAVLAAVHPFHQSLPDRVIREKQAVLTYFSSLATYFGCLPNGPFTCFSEQHL